MSYPASHRRPRALPERHLQERIRHLARNCGWLCYHTHDSRRSEPGFPDLVLVRERIIYAELKAEKGRIRPEQQHWIDRLRAAGADVRVWRPADWQEIFDTLTTRRSA